VCSDGDGVVHDGELVGRHGNGSQQWLGSSAPDAEKEKQQGHHTSISGLGLLPTPRQHRASAWAAREAKTMLARQDRAAAVAHDFPACGRRDFRRGYERRCDARGEVGPADGAAQRGTDAGAGPTAHSQRVRDAPGAGSAWERSSRAPIPIFKSGRGCLTGSNSKNLS
jgi:hypothetical protein